MARKRKVKNPYNTTHTVIYDNFPEEYTNQLGMPGLFHQAITRKVETKKVELETDGTYVALPDNKELKEKTIKIMEHSTKPMSKPKKRKMGDYVKYTYINANGVAADVTFLSRYKLRPEDRYIYIERNILIKVDEVDVSPEKIRKKLNSVKNKLKIENKLTPETGVNLGIAILYPPINQEVEILKEAIDLYVNAENDNVKLRKTLYTAFYCMIDAYIDDEDEFERLVKMISKNELTEIMEESNTILRLKDNEVNFKRRINESEEIIIEKDNIITEQEDQLTKKDNIITEQEDQLTKKDNEIDKLRALLRKNNIDITF